MTETQPLSEAPEDSPARRFRRVWGRVCIWGMGIFSVTAVALLASLIYSRPLRVSTETTYITGPLKSDGEQVDYFAAIRQATRPANASTDENGYRLILRHLGKPPDVDAAHFARLCEELGLDPEAIRPDMTYQQPYEFLASHHRALVYVGLRDGTARGLPEHITPEQLRKMLDGTNAGEPIDY